MKNKIVIIIVIGIAIACFISLRNRYQIGSRQVAPGEKVILSDDTQTTALPEAQQADVDYKLEEIARGLYVPWAIAFTSPSRILITERNGAIREINNGVLRAEPLVSFTEVSTRSEEGLMGMALHPQYTINKRLYVCLAYQKTGELVDKVIELRDEGSTVTTEKIILDDIPAAANHAGCRLMFGPDGKLYITTGDATEREIAQDTSSLGGKILRINDDGTIPTDNPFTNSPVWSTGHRNSQGIAWHPTTGELFATEHGPSGLDGPGGGDEVNKIVKGGNYGWPIVSHEKTDPRFIAPLLVFTPAEAPASAMFYDDDIFPQFKNNFFFGTLKGQGIIRIVLEETNSSKIISFEKLNGIDVGRIRDVVESPDGYIYFSTSNRDRRGRVRDGDDKIYRLIPK